MKNSIKNILILNVFLLIGTLSSFAQLTIPPKPTKISEQTSMYDYAKMLKYAEAKQLEQKLIKYSDSTSTQIVVATINSLKGEDIAMYATEWAHKWGIGGSEEKDNGVFLLVAKNDRKITIRTGYGVEHRLTDALSKRIITQVITPAFKQGQYYKGLDRGTDYIFKALNGEYKGVPRKSKEDSSIPIIFVVFFFIILFIILANSDKGNHNNGRRRRSTAANILESIILSNTGRSGGFGGGFGGGSSGGGFGGGGFGGGFGGGGFGGGGASGGW